MQGAYSRLAELMHARSLSVADFHKALAVKGYRFDLKTLYRLASDKPLMNISAPVVRAICETLKIDLGKLIVWKPMGPKLHRIDLNTQKRLDYLMIRSNEGELTAAERTELEKLAEALESLSIRNAKLLAQHTRPEPRRTERHTPGFAETMGLKHHSRPRSRQSGSGQQARAQKPIAV